MRSDSRAVPAAWWQAEQVGESTMPWTRSSKKAASSIQMASSGTSAMGEVSVSLVAGSDPVQAEIAEMAAALSKSARSHKEDE